MKLVFVGLLSKYFHVTKVFSKRGRDDRSIDLDGGHNRRGGRSLVDVVEFLSLFVRFLRSPFFCSLFVFVLRAYSSFFFASLLLQNSTVEYYSITAKRIRNDVY